VRSSSQRGPRLCPVPSTFGWSSATFPTRGTASSYAPTDGSGLRRVDPARGPVSLALGALGMPGFTAWIGTELLARPESGETMFVSSAAGAVGSLAGQLARLRGARVVGSTGSVDKVAWLVELGFDEAFNYRDGDILERLRSHAPDGLHVFFDNVGGDQLRAALESLRDFGRIIICGAIASYNTPVAPPGPDNLELIFLKALTVRGFRNYDFLEHHERFLDEMSALIKAGRVLAHEHIVDGIERAPAALIGMLRGGAPGKTLVRVAPG